MPGVKVDQDLKVNPNVPAWMDYHLDALNTMNKVHDSPSGVFSHHSLRYFSVEPEILLGVVAGKRPYPVIHTFTILKRMVPPAVHLFLESWYSPEPFISVFTLFKNTISICNLQLLSISHSKLASYLQHTSSLF
ncbi:hypothetical protein J5N97_007487 [Dioscorea zingiberensis]|uniref:Uncharacterized protein n=1 Tax=Dioscorea zingiberensis TaxID=325984 RepID=A0A9D5HUK9_9LILI|nr:hypothetical protein J5N97_007487 [Dioscorea zingiberensis]